VPGVLLGLETGDQVLVADVPDDGMYFLPQSSNTDENTQFGEITSIWQNRIWDNEGFVCKLELARL
jgi:hypothetical protein